MVKIKLYKCALLFRKLFSRAIWNGPLETVESVDLFFRYTESEVTSKRTYDWILLLKSKHNDRIRTRLTPFQVHHCTPETATQPYTTHSSSSSLSLSLSLCERDSCSGGAGPEAHGCLWFSDMHWSCYALWHVAHALITSPSFFPIPTIFHFFVIFRLQFLFLLFSSTTCETHETMRQGREVYILTMVMESWHTVKRIGNVGKYLGCHY